MRKECLVWAVNWGLHAWNTSHHVFSSSFTYTIFDIYSKTHKSSNSPRKPEKGRLVPFWPRSLDLSLCDWRGIALVLVMKHDSISGHIKYRMILCMSSNVWKLFGGLQCIFHSSYSFLHGSGVPATTFIAFLSMVFVMLWPTRYCKSLAQSSGGQWWVWSVLSSRWRGGSEEDGCSPVWCVCVWVG